MENEISIEMGGRTGPTRPPVPLHNLWQCHEGVDFCYCSGLRSRQHRCFRDLISREFGMPAAHSTDRSPVSVFLSYAWAVAGTEGYWQDKVNAWLVERMAYDLRAAGCIVYLDVWYDRLQRGLPEFMDFMPEADYLLPFGTPLYVTKCDRVNPDEDGPDHVVNFEVTVMKHLLMHSRRTRERVMPIVLDGTAKTSIPPLMHFKTKLHLTAPNDYFLSMLRLICDISERSDDLDPLTRELEGALMALGTAQDGDVDLSLIEEESPYVDMPSRGRHLGSRFFQTDTEPQLTHLTNLPPRNPFFTDRPELFERLEAALSTGVGLVSHAQAVVGLGAVGKSSLALEHAYREWEQGDARRFDFIRWMTMDSEERIKAEWTKFAVDLGLSAEGLPLAQLIRDVYARIRESRYLLVFDNTEKYDEVKDSLNAELGDAQAILVTSRRRDIWAQPVLVDVFTAEEAVAYVQQRLERVGRGSEFEVGQAGELAKAVGHLPLGLALAMSYVVQRVEAIADYCARLRERGTGAFEHTPVGDEAVHVDRRLSAVWQLGVGATGEEERQLLGRISLLASDNIPQALLCHLCDGDDGRLEALLQSLSDYALVTKDPVSRTISIHRLLQYTVARSIMGLDLLVPRWLPTETGSAEASARSWLLPVCRALVASLPEEPGVASDYKLIRDLIGHYHGVLTLISGLARQASQDAGQADLLAELNASLHACLGRAWFFLSGDGESLSQLAERGHDVSGSSTFDSASRQLQVALEADHDQMSGESAVPRARMLYYLGEVYLGEDRREEAGQCLEEARAIHAADSSSDRGNYINVLNALGWLARLQANYGQATEHYEAARRVCLQGDVLLDPVKHARTLVGMGHVHAERADYADAADCYRQALALRREHLPEGHAAVAGALLSLSSACIGLEHFTEAMDAVREAMEVYRGVHGESHPSFARAQVSLGNLYERRDEHELAQECFERALAIHRTVYTGAHGAIAGVLNNLGVVNTAMGRYRQALDYFEQTEACYRALVGDAHPKVANTLANKAEVYQKQGNWRQAQEAAQQAFEMMSDYPIGNEIKLRVITVKSQVELGGGGCCVLS